MDGADEVSKGGGLAGYIGYIGLEFWHEGTGLHKRMGRRRKRRSAGLLNCHIMAFRLLKK